MSEKVSQRKLQKAREEGNVAQSSDLVKGIQILGGLLFLYAMGGAFKRGFQECFQGCFQIPLMSGVDEIGCIVKERVYPFLFILLPFFLLLITIGLFGFVLQRGWLFSLKKKKNGVKKSFAFLLVKFVSFTTVVFFMLRATFYRQEYTPDFFFKALLTVSAFFVLLGAADFFYRRWQWKKGLKMTPQEVKEEMREQQVAPELKEKMRAKRV